MFCGRFSQWQKRNGAVMGGRYRICPPRTPTTSAHATVSLLVVEVAMARSLGRIPTPGGDEAHAVALILENGESLPTVALAVTKRRWERRSALERDCNGRERVVAGRGDDPVPVLCGRIGIVQVTLEVGVLHEVEVGLAGVGRQVE